MSSKAQYPSSYRPSVPVEEVPRLVRFTRNSVPKDVLYGLNRTFRVKFPTTHLSLWAKVVAVKLIVVPATFVTVLISASYASPFPVSEIQMRSPIAHHVASSTTREVAPAVIAPLILDHGVFVAPHAVNLHPHCQLTVYFACAIAAL